MDLKTLVSLYINLKLTESGLIINKQFPTVLDDKEKEIFSASKDLCSELERDSRFSDVVASFRRFGIEKESFNAVLEQLLIDELNWPRVMSVLTLAGALAVECMKRGDEHKLDFIQDWTISFAEEKLSPWIEANGGLDGLLTFTRRKDASSINHVSHWERNLIAAGTVGFITCLGLYVASRA